MLVLSNLGCQVFFWLGLIDQKGCDELRAQEENLDTLMWFKLLFVPTLGIIILTLFLLEDYCYSVNDADQGNNDTGNNTDANILNNNSLLHNTRNKRKGTVFW